MITNQKVYNAINQCIEKRWKPIVKNGGCLSFDTPSCHLCVLFFDGVSHPGCGACPLYLVEGKTCRKSSSTFYKWRTSQDIRSAQAVVDLLIKAREYFFGDWE